MTQPDKTFTIPQLRQWQQAALDQYRIDGFPHDWLVSATPGAGKTTYGFAAAEALWRAGLIRRVIVVTPTDHLRSQWVEAAARAGFDLRPTPNNERLPADADGMVATYAQVANASALFRGRSATRSTLVIMDEVHHIGDQLSWGQAVIDAFEGASHRLLVTGTPFRSDQALIPGVRYLAGPDGERVSSPDFSYGYADALRDGVVRPIVFAAYTGQVTWRNSVGDIESATLGDTDLTRAGEDAAWRTALAPDGEWLPHVFAAAHLRCGELRASGRVPDAAVLVLAGSQETARAYADVWKEVTGAAPLVILSDDDDASARIARFRDDPDIECAVAVRMVTEGVDVPRAAVLVYATPASTPLFFAQSVGRVVRARKRGEAATVFLPAVPKLLGLAAELERQRDHVIPPADTDEHELDPAPDPRPETPDERLGPAWSPVGSRAAFDRVIASSSSPSPEPLDGLPGLLTPEQEATILARRDEEAAKAAKAALRRRARDAKRAAVASGQELVQAQHSGDLPNYLKAARESSAQHSGHDAGGQEEAARLRRAIHSEVMSIVARTGKPPRDVWAALYRVTPGPKNAAASLPLLRSRLAAVVESRIVA